MDYKHRLPFKSVDSFHVDGKVALNLVAFQLAVRTKKLTYNEINIDTGK